MYGPQSRSFISRKGDKGENIDEPKMEPDRDLKPSIQLNLKKIKVKIGILGRN